MKDIFDKDWKDALLVNRNQETEYDKIVKILCLLFPDYKNRSEGNYFQNIKGTLTSQSYKKGIMFHLKNTGWDGIETIVSHYSDYTLYTYNDLLNYYETHKLLTTVVKELDL